MVRDLVYRATGAVGRRRTQLLRQAIATCPDCFEAYLQLAERATRPEQSTELFRAGLAKAAAALGQARLAELKGRYWADRQARVFLRLRLGLGLGLRALGRLEEAAAELQQVLSLDGPDHAGARDYLLSLLLELGRDDDAEDLLERFEDGGVAWWYRPSAARIPPAGEA